MGVHFKIDTNSYDTDKLSNLGTGTYGDVYDIGDQMAAKIYFDAQGDEQRQKLLKMCDGGATIAEDSEVGKLLALPTSLALDPSGQSVLGFSMRSFGDSPKIAALSYDLQNKAYRERNGYRFTDETAVKAIFDLFLVLSALSKRHVVLGDISAANVLFNIKERAPGLIDLDSAHYEDWESDSPGTPGYIDPHLIETDLNSLGGLNFDTKSDVFALTVLAYLVFIGSMPFSFGSEPDADPDDNALRRLSTLRIAVEGENCLRQYGMRLISADLIRAVEERLAHLRQVRGASGNDGVLLCDHFVRVFIDDGRENLVAHLPDQDIRNPALSLVRLLRTNVILDELDRRFSKSKPTTAVVRRQLISAGAVSRQKTAFRQKDPSAFGPFLAVRGIDFAAMISK